MADELFTVVDESADPGATGTAATFTVGFVDVGPEGPQGPPGDPGQDGADGPPGVDGESAYELAVDAGFSGTLNEWLASLVGAKGDQGDPGSDGVPGSDGADGSPGADGRGITSVARTSGTGAAGTTDTYTITYSDSTTSTFEVVNGSVGSAGPQGDPGIPGADGADGQDGMIPWLDVTTYGATGDGTTDDRTAINSAIADLNSAGGGVLYFPAGTYKVTAALTTINVPATVIGDGCADSHFRAAPTTINFTTATTVLFTVGTSGHGTKFADLNLVNTAASTPSAGAAIQVLGGDGARYERLSIKGFWINMDMQDGQEWTMDSCFIYSPVKYGIKLQHVDLPDGGDMGITNCQFLCGDYSADAAIRWESGGGLRLTNCKINTRTLSHFFSAGLDAAIGSITTVDLLVGACSFENITGPCIKGTVAGGGEFSAVAIAGNQFGYYASTSAAAVDITGWIDVTVVGNTALARFSGSSAAAVKLTSVTRGAVGLNTVEGFSGGELSQTTCTGIITSSTHTHAESDITNLVSDLAAKVPTTRTVSTDSTMTGGGDLSANRTLGVDTTAEAERIRDVIGAALVAGSGATITVNDAGDTITIALSGGGSGTLTVQDENSNVATSVTQIDFQGSGVTATSGTGEVVVTIPGGGGILALAAGASIPGGTAADTLVFRKSGWISAHTADSAVALITLDETSGVFADQSGNGRDFTAGTGVTRGLTALLGDGGKAASGDGSHSIATLGSNGGIGQTGTLEAWISLPSTNVAGNVVAVGTLAAGWGINISNGAGSAGRQLCAVSPGINYYGSGYTFPTGTGIFHIAMTLASHTATWYVNGVKVGTATIGDAAPGAGLSIGSTGSGDFLSSTVVVDHVAFYSTVLSAQRIKEHAFVQPYSLLGYYDGTKLQPLGLT